MIYTSPFKVDNVEKTFTELSRHDGVIVFGTGNTGAVVLAALKKVGISVVCLSDNNKHRWGKIINGHKVVPPKDLQSTKNQTPILIAVDLNFPYIRKIEVESLAKKTIDIIDNPLIANVDSLYKIVYENINAVIEARKLEKFYKYFYYLKI